MRLSAVTANQSSSPPVFKSNFAFCLSSDIIVMDTASRLKHSLLPTKSEFKGWLLHFFNKSLKKKDLIDKSFFFCNMEQKSRRVGLLHNVTGFSQGVCPTLQDQIPLRAENVRKPLLN